MPKRKRSEVDIEETLAQLRQELFHALKLVKGFERQRQAKRKRNDPAKAERIEKEILVLKSLELHQTASVVLANALLKIKPIAQSPKLPDEIKAGAPKPDISEEEKVHLHNVTSALCHYAQVRTVLDKAVTAVCKALRVSLPEKGKGKKSTAKDKEDKSVRPPHASVEHASEEGGGRHVASESRVKERKPETSREAALVADGDNENEEDVEEQERAVDELDKMLGSGSESDSEQDDDNAENGEDEEAVEENGLDPMEITSDEGEEEDDGFGEIELEDEGNETSFNGFDSDAASEDEQSLDEASDSDAPSVPNPPKKPKVTGANRIAVNVKSTKGSDDIFLSSLRSGYISGSESASDIDDELTTRKNRRGQRARQAIWEKKFKQEAKHLRNQNKGGKDAGWDPKRGAVGGDDRRPWKQGVRNPLERNAREEKYTNVQPAREKKQTQNEGPLHPSWEAARKAKEKALSAPFQGKRITFD